MKGKKYAIAGLTAGLLAGGGAGLVMSVGGPVGAASVDTTAVDDTQRETPPDSARRSDRRAAKLQEILQPLIDDGTITQAQADAVIAALQAARPRDGGHHRGMGRHGESLQEVADLLGLTIEELGTQLRDGQTLAEIAVANGSTAQAVIDLLVAERTEQINERVAHGHITQEQADARLADLTERITTMVNEGGPRLSKD
jgi:polyhydroxyalkanoate synthesis regulator phasin